ncbi:ribosomal protein S18-alanine N-acetyltransferase [Halobaculum sp. P14]|uniref:ribosomal protein S18-alanine N-acetyltransferase n=1 Tax=Halobaculum sp. P14 TaxID=3421638 RepID=UPI003EBB8B1B
MTTSRGAVEGGAPGEDGIDVRVVTRADLLSVFRIEQAVFTQPWPFAAFENLLDAEGFFVATADAAADVGADGIAAADVLGYVVADVLRDHGRDIGHVKDIAVRPGGQGHGVGRRLLRRALRRLATVGASVVKLEVRESNHRAQSLYRSEGFEPVRRVSQYYGDGEDAFVMAVDLGEWIRTANRCDAPEDG